MLPRFILAGFQKSGTTYLDSLIRQHPQIYLPERTTEYSFFDDSRIYDNGIDWYKSIFQNAPNHCIIGQTSADCAFDPKGAHRIKTHIPDAKLIFVLRNPISRTYSNYWHQIKMGRERYSFEEALEKETNRTSEGIYNIKTFSYLERSRYYDQMENVLSNFNSKQVMVLPFELFVKNELYFLNEIFEFLDVKKIETLGEIDEIEKETNPSKIPVSPFLIRYSFLFNSSKLGRYIFSKLLITKKPPKMNADTYALLQEKLEVDIRYYESVTKDWEFKINNA